MNYVDELLDFTNEGVTAFHVVSNISEKLKNNGFLELIEGEDWDVKYGGKYFVTRNDSSVIAFKIPQKECGGFNIAAAHSDAPTFKLKPEYEMSKNQNYISLNIEGYGGMLCATWLDRPLSVAGRIIAQTQNGIEARLVKLDRDIALIPSVAIHMDRKANSGHEYKMNVDMLPLIGSDTSKNKLEELLAKTAGIDAEALIGHDLYLYNRMKSCVWGADDEYISASKLDDLQCAYSILRAFIDTEDINNISVCCVFDNEEVGSLTMQGASSTFLYDTLKRTVVAMGKSEVDYQKMIASSFMVSADNAHAMHPNYPELSDVKNAVLMNKGVVIKTNASQKYATDAISMAIFKKICDRARVPYQMYANRSDMAGGSTLGNLSNAQVSLRMVDIGLAQLAMHSAYETAGVKDTEYLINAMAEFYRTTVKYNGNNMYTLI